MRHPKNLILLVAAAGFAPACDNVSCVFGPGNCGGPGGGAGLGEQPATLPRDGEWIETSAPRITNVLPSSTQPADTRTPIALVFSESLAPANFGATPPTGLATAFELQSQTGVPVPIPVAVLVGDGRVLVLLPPAELQPDTTYDIVLRDTAELADLTGQTFLAAANGLIGSFTTAPTNAVLPRVLVTWPLDAAVDQSETGEIAVVFDRPMNELTIDSDSFDVVVDGNPPPSDPDPTPLGIGGLATDRRVFRWRSVDGQGDPAPLGQGADVEVTLSPTANEIEDEDGEVLPQTIFDFVTASFSAPVSAAITSFPNDAIGIDQISGPADLAVEVQLSGAQAGDSLVLTLFGVSLTGTDPPLIALRREIPLVPPFTSFTLTAAEIDLLQSGSPVQGRFRDGEVAFAFQVKRGVALSPVRLLDVDADADGMQNPLLDTVPPRLLGLGLTGVDVTHLRSDLRDIALFGRASEVLRRALVSTVHGNNEITPGAVPPVVGSSPSGFFIAAPVRVGLLPAASLPVDFVMTMYDRALNSAVAQSSTSDPGDGFYQLGASGPAVTPPGGLMTVEVFEPTSATTLAPVAGAQVHVHQNLGGTVTPVAGGLGTTDAQGLAQVPAAPAGETIVTVDAAGFDLFTLDRVPTLRIGIPLTRVALALAEAEGTLGPADLVAASQLNATTRAVVDSRRPETASPFAPVATCTFDSAQSQFECPFGPIPVRSRRFGSQTAISVIVPPSVFAYSALTFLKCAELAVPVPPISPGASAESRLTIPFLLDAGGLDAEESAVDVPAHMLSTANWPALATDPVVTVEATVPGMPASAAVGRGVAFDDALPPDTWVVRAAYPGAADGIQDVPTDELGRLVQDGTIDADLLLRVDVADTAGNRGGVRPRLSATTLALTPPAPPVLPGSPVTPNPGGVSLDLTFPDVLPDAVSPPGRGLYRVVLLDVPGRSWTVYRFDPSNAAGPNVVMHLPELSGVFPLASGPVDCRISAWSWPTLGQARLLWSDIEREHDLFVHSKVQSIVVP